MKSSDRVLGQAEFWPMSRMSISASVSIAFTSVASTLYFYLTPSPFLSLCIHPYLYSHLCSYSLLFIYINIYPYTYLYSFPYLCRHRHTHTNIYITMCVKGIILYSIFGYLYFQFRNAP